MGANVQSADQLRAQVLVPVIPVCDGAVHLGNEGASSDTIAEYRCAIPSLSEVTGHSCLTSSLPAPISLLSGKTRVLVVDDERDIADELAAYLERHAFACSIAVSAEAAVAVLRHDPNIAIVVTDICMGALDGLTMLRNLQRQVGNGREFECIVLTGAPSVDRAAEALRLGAVDFLPKPIRPKQLLASVLSAEERIRCRLHQERDLRTLTKEKARLRSAFAHYVGSSVVERIEENPGEISRRGKWQIATFLFTDIADYTKFTENTDPKQLIAVLNAYLDGLSGLVLEYGGQVDKFVGDAMVAMFDHETEGSTAAQRAVECAMAIDEFADGFRRRLAANGSTFGATRIGVHTGQAFVGNIGGQDRFEFTGIGDAVNIAARLEAANKELGTRICVSDVTASNCAEIEFRSLGDVALKGKSGLHSVLTPTKILRVSPCVGGGGNEPLSVVEERPGTPTTLEMRPKTPCDGSRSPSIQARAGNTVNLYRFKKDFYLSKFISDIRLFMYFISYFSKYLNYNIGIAILFFRNHNRSMRASTQFVASKSTSLADSLGLGRKMQRARRRAVRNPS